MRKFISSLLAVAFIATSATVVTGTGAFSRDRQEPVYSSSSKRPQAKYQRKKVRIDTGERPGTIIVDTNRKYLYYYEGNGKATRYGVGVGRDGFGWSGTVKVGRKAEWPDWRPPATMIRRERAKGHNLPAFVPGGINNPLGARAMYLHKGGRDTIYRIHGTNQPWTIGQNMSSGCIRMMNKDVEHLYSRAPVGTKVIVIGPGSRNASNVYSERGVDVFGSIFSFGG
ncbi:MAG: L,D-transpeptidase [Rhizobiaceae bacterium MnEN-MB40S]|nr:MAG: L,D-transpeptidase [Rhizobiaceae bacterium MnEN-MB40S]